MLISNLAVDQRFCNGTQGRWETMNIANILTHHKLIICYLQRLLHWHPDGTKNARKALPSYCPDLLARFCKESSLGKIKTDDGERYDCCTGAFAR